MTKKQKILLVIFVAMFALPEILWSSVGNFLYQFFDTSNNVHPFRDNFLQRSDNIKILGLVLYLQFFGLLLSAFYIIKLNLVFKKFYMGIAGVLLALMSLVVFFMAGLASTFNGIG